MCQDEDEGAGADSELDESESEAEAGAEDFRTTPEPCACADAAPSGVRGCQKAQAKSSEEVGRRGPPQTAEKRCDAVFRSVVQEPEWDVSSAFVANAASHIRPKGSSRRSKENKENEAKREVSGRAAGTPDGAEQPHVRVRVSSNAMPLRNSAAPHDSFRVFYRQTGLNGKKARL